MSQITFWVILGTGLLIAEMLTGTFFLLFFALGSFCASLFALLGSDSLAFQTALCALVSVAGFVILKKPLQKRFSKTVVIQNDVGQTLTLEISLPAGQTSRVNYQGTTWHAINQGSVDLNEGDTAVIVGTAGLTLLLQKHQK